MLIGYEKPEEMAWDKALEGRRVTFSVTSDVVQGVALSHMQAGAASH
jgi:hypothetical protein